MILGRHRFEHQGQKYHAELRIIGFALDESQTVNPRWVIFDEDQANRWTLPGDGMITETADDVQLRFTDHLTRVADRARVSGEELLQ
jgi:hypothetical protein